MRVAEIQRGDDLPKELPCLLWRESALFHQIVEQLAAGNVLQHQISVYVWISVCMCEWVKAWIKFSSFLLDVSSIWSFFSSYFLLRHHTILFLLLFFFCSRRGAHKTLIVWGKRSFLRVVWCYIYTKSSRNETEKAMPTTRTRFFFLLHYWLIFQYFNFRALSPLDLLVVHTTQTRNAAEVGRERIQKPACCTQGTLQ